MKKMIIASTSTIHGSSFLEYLNEDLVKFFKNVKTILFIPYARTSGITHDEYTFFVKERFKKLNKEVVGIHTFQNQKDAIENAEAIYVGGGNTFVLVSKLYKYGLIEPLTDRVLTGIPYLGTSAGSNITGINMKNTNDMPIVYPPSFKTLGLIPFNINPHYKDPIIGDKHMGETRETRIKEFHKFNDVSVIGLREGSWLSVYDTTFSLEG